MKVGAVSFVFGLALVASCANAQNNAVPPARILVLNNGMVQPETKDNNPDALDAAVTQALSPIVKRYNANIVLDRRVVISGSDKVDVTTEVLAQLRRIMPAAGFPLVPIAAIDTSVMSAPKIMFLDRGTVARVRSDGSAGLDEASLQKPMQDHGVDLLIDAGAVIFADPGFDLTPAIVQQPGASLPAGRPIAPTIVVMNRNVVLQESNAGRDVERQVKDITARLTAALKPQSDELHKERANLDQEVAVSGPSTHLREIADFNAKQQAYQLTLQQRQTQIEQAVEMARQKIDAVVSPLVRDVMHERGANIILDRGAIAIASPALDITAAVVQRLDKNLPALKLEIPFTLPRTQ